MVEFSTVPVTRPYALISCCKRLKAACSGFAMLIVAVLLLHAAPAHATTCANAIVINPTSLPILNQAMVCGAANDLNGTNVPGGLCYGTGGVNFKNGLEALYNLTPTTTGTYNFSMAAPAAASMQIWAGCPTAGGTCIWGTTQTSVSVTLNAGTTYYIWFDSRPTGTPSSPSPCPGTFSIALQVPPVNDDPCSATSLPVNANCVNTASTTTGATSTSGVPAPGCASYSGGDVWFAITVPTGGAFSVNTTAGTITDGGMALYTATACNGTFTLVSCNDDLTGLMPGITASGLIVGSTVYVRFWEYGNDNPGTFSICATLPPPPPANDNPCGAVALTVNPDYACGVQTNGSLVSATPTTGVPTAPCGGTPNDDVWYKFTATGTVHRISLNDLAGSTYDMYMAVYSGSCTTLANVACSDPESMIVTGLTAGNTYWVRVYSWSSASGATTTFNICVGTPPPPPANDDPCGAVALTVNPDLLCGIQTAGTLAAATPTTGVSTSPCYGTPNDDVWFKFTATSTTHRVSLNNITGNYTDMYMAVYSGPCTALDNMACSDFNSLTLTALTIGNIYWVRVYSYTNSTSPNTTFNICVGTPPPPPTCGQMFYDNGGPSGNYLNNSDDLVTICPTTPGDLVTLTFSSFNVDDYDELAIYDGLSTASPLLGYYYGTTMPPVITATNSSGCLTAEFYSGSSVNYPGWAAQVSCAPPPAGDCVYVLHLHDSNGNGWGSSSVTLTIVGVSTTNYTVTGSDNTVLIGVNIGEVIDLQYNAVGGGQGQNSYTLSKLGEYPYFISATPPVAGITFSQTVTCAPPAAPPQDCIGAVTICGSTEITSSSNGSGQVEDLNDDNRGCLYTEHQGSWYYFSPQTNGTIAFSITPANNSDDYDFAVWGPYPSAQCPTGPPLRCSYDAPGPAITGLNASATDTTEGASGTGWVKDIQALADQVFVLYVDNFSHSGQAFTLDWQLGPGSSLDCTVLPVELLDLAATPRDRVIDVDWATATEHNSDHFVVERSAGDLVFAPIGQMPAAGQSTQRVDYRFTDPFPLNGFNYYRLRQVDLNGATELSQTVVAIMDGTNGMPVLFPNPVEDVLNIGWSGDETTVRILVRDATGRTVASGIPGTAQGGVLQLPVAHLARGCYSVAIAVAHGVELPGGMFVKR